MRDASARFSGRWVILAEGLTPNTPSPFSMKKVRDKSRLRPVL